MTVITDVVWAVAGLVAYLCFAVALGRLLRHASGETP